MNKARRALALLLTFVMAVSVLTITPTTTVEAASKKYVQSLKLNKSKTTLNSGAKTTVKATVKVKGTSSKSYKKVKVSLTKDNKKAIKKVTVGSPDSKGVSKITITAKDVTKKTTTKLKVTTTQKNSKGKQIYKYLTVTVNPKVIAPASVSVTAANTSIAVGTTTVVKATVSPSNAKDKTVTWSSSNAAVATVDANGVVKGIKAGTATIIAKTSNGKTGSVTITVTGIVPASVSVAAESTSIAVGTATVVTATVLPANAADKTVTWSSSNAAVAAVNANGVVTGIKAGTATITARTSNGKTGSVTITVTSVPVTGITLDQATAELYITGTTTLTATIAPASATEKGVTWASSDENVAVVDASGKVTAKAVGTATITATTVDGSIQAKCVVNVISKSTLADGMTIEMTNPYSDANGKEYANTQLVGQDMTIQVRLVKEGKPVGNANVRLEFTNSFGNCPNAFGVVSESSSVRTDENGYANFEFGLKDNYDYNAVSGYYQSYILTAKDSATGTAANLTVKFASVDKNDVMVLNNTNYAEIEDGDVNTSDSEGYYLGYEYLDDIVPSDNASARDDGVKETWYINKDYQEEYVSTQQTSVPGVEDRRVYLSASPYLILPATEEEAHLDDWEYIVPKAEGTSGPCSVYNTSLNKTTTVEVYDVPAGLHFVTLYFDKFDISRYTKVLVEVLDSATGERISYKERAYGSNDTPTIQVEAQEDRESYIVVSLISEGQVDTSHTGYVLSKLVGAWASQGIEQSVVEEIAGTVKWTNISNDVAYETSDWSYDEAVKYLPANSEFLNKNFEYTLSVPAFPCTGNALMNVKKDDGQTASFLYPTVNGGEGDVKNVNVLADPDSNVVAIKATEGEINARVGELKTEGNIAIVDSTSYGITGLKAEVTVPGLDATELNNDNGGRLYTSIQWSQNIIEEEEVYVPTYYAIEGQQVEVTAKLYDQNGQPATDAGGKTVEFYCGEDKIDATQGAYVGAYATVVGVDNNCTTNNEGTVKIRFKDNTNNNLFAYINDLTAKTKGYKVKLSFDGVNFVDAGNIEWVDLGLYFCDSAVEKDAPVETIHFDNETTTIAKGTEYTVNDQNAWKVGYRVIGRAPSFGYEQFVSASEISVAYSHESKNVTLDQNKEENVAILSSTKVGKDKVTGRLDWTDENKAKPSDVIFTFYNAAGELETHQNVGTGVPNIISTEMILNTEWKLSSATLALIAPVTVNQTEDTEVYVVHKDICGNPITDAQVKYNVTGPINKEGTVTTNEKGIAVITLEAPDDITINTAIVTAKVNDALSDTANITYTAQGADKPFTVNVDAESESGDYDIVVKDDNQTIEVYFTNAIDASTIDAKQFSFAEADGVVTYKVESATLDSSKNACIILKLDKAIENVDKAHQLTISSYTDNDGIVHTLMDTYGHYFDGFTDKTIVPENYR